MSRTVSLCVTTAVKELDPRDPYLSAPVLTLALGGLSLSCEQPGGGLPCETTGYGALLTSGGNGSGRS
eukprot:561165-Hanusia_phi.AAC.4